MRQKWGTTVVVVWYLGTLGALIQKRTVFECLPQMSHVLLQHIVQSAKVTLPHTRYGSLRYLWVAMREQD